jgi:8-oxo-dGTP pyrophosphatase MutT (NUDIX family)
MKTRRVNVRGIIFSQGKLLLTKFRQDDGSESNHWGTFGGGLDSGESLAVGLQREMIEETGIAPTIGKLLFIQQFEDEEKEYLEFFFHIENTKDYEVVDLETTSHGALELTTWAYVDPKSEYVMPSFLSTVDIEAIIYGNEPVYMSSELGNAR